LGLATDDVDGRERVLGHQIRWMEGMEAGVIDKSRRAGR
jgi:hypothetical protein